MQQGLLPWSCYVALKDHHLPLMRPELKRLLLRRAWAQSTLASATAESVSPPTIRRWLDLALSQVFDTLLVPVPRDSYAAATWVMAHLDCCLQEQVVELRKASNG
jgi:uncharacterized protein YceK